MANRGRPRTLRFLSSGYFPPGTKWLLIANVAAFLACFFIGNPPILELIPADVAGRFWVWQLATYMFLHGGFSHIIWNMLALWMFGAELEREWGTRSFLKFYLSCGVGAGVCVVIANYIVGTPEIPTIGSSGAIFGLLMAYAMLYPRRTILFSFLFPIEARWFVLIVGAVSLMMSIGGGNSGVSAFAHLGGLLTGYIYLKAARARFDPLRAMEQGYGDWKRRRLKKKFQVYLKKHDDRGPWVN
jgi:membrane associated rhomboid family serine protease